MKRILLLACLLLFALPVLADQGVLTNSGGSTNGAGGLYVSTSGVVPAGTLNLSCPGASINVCSGGSVLYLSSDGLTTISGVFTSGSLVEGCAGGGKGGHVTCAYSFTGYFSGTATINGVVQSINGVTYQYFGSTGANAQGLTTWNSAYTPLYYSDTEQIVRTDDLTGTNQVVYGSQGSGVGQFYIPYGIATDSKGRIYVADTYNCRIVRIDDMNGTNWTTYGSTCGSAPGHLSFPTGITIDPAGRIYITDAGNHRLVRMDDMLGTNFTSYGKVGTGVGQFSTYILSPVIDAAGRIYFTDILNERVVRIDDMLGTNWIALKTSPVINGATYTLQSPTAVGLDAAGKIYIVENTAPQDLVIRVDDMLGTNWTQIGVGTGQANSLSVDSGGSVFVGVTGIKLIDSMQTVTNSSGTIGPYGPAYITAVSALRLPSLRPPAMTISGTALAFANQNIGTTSTAQMISITNFGGSPLDFSSVTTSAGFTNSTTCPSALVAGASCTISVSFSPSITGPTTGTLTIADNSGNMGASQVVSLSGVATVPSTQVSPTSVSFPSQLLNSASSAASVILMNTGTGPLSVTSIAVTGPFTETDNCTVAMAPGGGCTVMVTFTPTATGSASGTLTFVDNAGTQIVSLSGSGTTTAPVVTISPGSLLFPDQLIGTLSGAQTLTVTNTGATTVANNGVTITGYFAETTTCGTTLRASRSCTISVTFDPTAAGPLIGTLNVAMATGTLTASLTGTGVVGPVPSVLTFNPQAVSFNNNYVVGDNPSQTITVTNTSNAAVGLGSIVTSGDPSYTQQTNCGTLLLGGASCTISITFIPTTYGTFVGQVTIIEGSGAVDVIPISGTAFLNGG